MTRALFEVEYVFDKGSAQLLWRMVSTATGLADWFADQVDEKESGKFTFEWGKSQQDAVVVSLTPGVRIRFHWVDDPEPYYFEFRIESSELTKSVTLHITEHSDEVDHKSSMNLWNAQIEVLMRKTGM